MISAIRKTATFLLIALMALAPTLAQADGVQYFRMNGRAGQAPTGGTGSPGQGVMSYSVSGSSAGILGLSYSAVSQVTGAVGAVAFVLQSGALPPGTTLDSVTGAVSGTLTAVGVFDAVLRATDAAAATATAALHVEVSAIAVGWAPAPGKVGQTYVASPPAVAGGRAPYVYSLGGTAPSGLLFTQATGLLSGVPSAEGSYSVSVTVIDADGLSASSGPRTLVVAPADVVPPSPALALSGNPPTLAQVGIGYAAHFTGTGGTAPYSYVQTGTLPPGLAFDAATGTISGSPTAEGIYPGLKVTVTDATSATAFSATFAIAVQPQPQLLISGDPSGSARVGEPYSAMFTAFDGSGGGYSFASVGGALPPGLTLSAVGSVEARLAGSPSVAGTYSGIVIRVTDSENHAASTAPFSIVVASPEPLAVSMPAGTVSGTPQAAFATPAPTVTGLKGVASFALSPEAATSLQGCPGLAFSDATGVISGTPTAPCTLTDATIQVVDSAGGAAAVSQPFSVRIGGTWAKQDMMDDGSTPVLRAGQGIEGTYGTDLPSPSWSIATQSPASPALALDPAASPGHFIVNLPDVAAPTTFTYALAATAGGVTETTASQTVTVIPLLAIASQPVTVVGLVGQPMAPTPPLAVTGGVGTVTISWVATTPISADFSACSGLTLDPATGVISGTPTATCVLPSLRLTAHDSYDNTTAYSGLNFLSFTDLTIAGASGTVSGHVGAPFSIPAPTTTGTRGTKTFALLQGGSPIDLASSCPGLAFQTATGGIYSTNIPNVLYPCSLSDLTIRVSDLTAFTATTSPPFAISISMGTPSGALAGSAVAGNAYSSGPLTPVGGTGSYIWAVDSGALPDGLTLDPTSGVVSGTPTAAGSFTFGIKVKDSSGIFSPAATQTIVVAQPTAALTFYLVPQTGAVFHEGTAITGQMSSNLVNPTWTFSGVDFLAPAGATSNATFTGVAPAQTSQTLYSFTATATKGAVSASTVVRSFTVIKYFRITGGASGTVTGTVGTPIAATPAVGYDGSNIAAGPALTVLKAGSVVDIAALCPGLSLQANGQISGTPAAPCSQSGLTIRATDSDGQTATSANFAISIMPAPLSVSGTPSAGTVGSAYAWSPAIAGGTAPYTVSYTTTGGPTLASMGLSMAPASGAISGTPTAGGTWNGTITVTDAVNATVVSSALTLTVGGGTPVLSGSLKSPWATGVAIPTATFVANGGVQPYVWSLTAGSTAVPAGLSINASGQVTGTPTVAGTYNFNVRATNASGGLSGTLPVTLVVSGSVFVITSGVDGAAFQRWPGFDVSSLWATTKYNASGTVTYTMTGQGASGIGINASTGSPTGVLTSNYGSYQLTITGTDQASHVSSYTVTVNISHRSGTAGSEPLAATIYRNGVVCGTGTAGAASCSGTLSAVGDTLELVYERNAATSQFSFSAATWPTSATVELSSSADGVSYASCGAAATITSANRTASCSNGLVASRFRARVTAISGSWGGPGMSMNAYFNPPD